MKVATSKSYLYEVGLNPERIGDGDVYPYSLPAIRALEALQLHPSVTIFIGENGSGKSTLLEAIAVAWGFNPEGGTRNFNFSTRASHSDLHQALRLVRTPRRPRDGFFLRAESFYNVATQIEHLGVGNAYGGRSLHEQSHGEAFLALIFERFKGNGLYILDEPEAALSPARQLTAVARIVQLTQRKSQFIIATHSPIIMGIPDAQIHCLSERGIEAVRYEDTDHYAVTRQFLINREAMLARILGK